MKQIIVHQGVVLKDQNQVYKDQVRQKVFRTVQFQRYNGEILGRKDKADELVYRFSDTKL